MLPNTLLYIVDRLAGFSTNVFQLNPVASNSAASRGVIEFLLPSNAPINLSSFKVNFTATVTGSSAGGRFPPDIHSLIQRVEVSCGGILVSSGGDYFNVLNAAKTALMGNKCCSVLGHPEVVREVGYYSGSGIITTTGPEAVSSSTNPVFTWENFDGFLQSCKPHIIDTGLIPQLRVKITLAGPEVLISSAGVSFAGTTTTGFNLVGTKAADYTVSNISAMIEGVSFGDNTYNQMVSALMAKKSYIEVPYKNYYSFSSTHSGSSAFNVSCQSLDRIYWAWRASGFDTQAGGIVVEGHKVAGGFTSSTASVAVASSAVALDTEIGIPSSGDIGGIETYNTNSEKYTGKYFNFVDPTLSSDVSSIKLQLKLNNSSFPDFQATASEWLNISKNSLPAGEKLRTMTSLQYLGNYFTGCCRLNYPGSEEMRIISGLDTRGISMSASLNTSGSMSSPNLSIFLETTATLQIAPARQIAVIQ